MTSFQPSKLTFILVAFLAGALGALRTGASPVAVVLVVALISVPIGLGFWYSMQLGRRIGERGRGED